MTEHERRELLDTLREIAQQARCGAALSDKVPAQNQLDRDVRDHWLKNAHAVECALRELESSPEGVTR